MSKSWQGTETPAVDTAHPFHFLLCEIRNGVFLVWHRKCQTLTLQRFRSEHSSCCLPWGTQELVQVFEIRGLSIIKKESDSCCWKALESSLGRFQWNTKKIANFGPFSQESWMNSPISALMRNVVLCREAALSSAIRNRIEKVMLGFYFFSTFMLICCILT